MTDAAADPPRTDAPGSAVPVDGVPGATVEEQMRADLTVAMRERDKVRVRALRTALAAIANAEAPPLADAPSWADEPVVGALVEHRRLELAPGDIERILHAEIADRVDTATQFETHGRVDEAETVRAEAAVIGSYLS